MFFNTNWCWKYKGLWKVSLASWIYHLERLKTTDLKGKGPWPLWVASNSGEHYKHCPHDRAPDLSWYHVLKPKCTKKIKNVFLMWTTTSTELVTTKIFYVIKTGVIRASILTIFSIWSLTVFPPTCPAMG